jgi:ribonuclease P protein component
VSVQRLKTREQFQAVMAAGTVSRTSHFALHRCALSIQDGGAGVASSAPAPLQLAPDVWVGALIPKRWAKRAVTRNAIKRQIYAVSEASSTGLPLSAHVVRLRTTFDRKQFVSATSDALKSAVRGELQQLFERAAQIRPAVTAEGGTP